MLKLRFGMPTLLECPTLEANIALCRALGLSYLELNMNLPYCLPARNPVDDLRKLADGLPLTLHLPEGTDIAAVHPTLAAAHRAIVWEGLRFAAQLHMPCVILHMEPGIYFTLPEGRVYLYERYNAAYLRQIETFREEVERFLRPFGEAAPLLCIENTGLYGRAYITQAVEALLESPRFALCFDVGHDAAANNADIDFIMAHAERIAHMHLHDARATANHLPLGTGDLPLHSRLLCAENANARVTIEVKTVQGLRVSLDWLRDQAM